MNLRKPFSLLLSLGALCLSAQTIDQTYNQKIKEHTTDSRFLPTSVLNVVDHPTIPSPLKFFGTIIGEPGVMHRTTDIYRYYQKLSETSANLKMQQVGTTEEGRPIHLIVIANDDGLKRVGHYKNQLALLADPRKVNATDVSKIIGDSKPIFYLNGGLHSPEMGSPEMLMELAYRLVTDQSDATKNILNNVIVLINPVSEPDGRDKQVDWYYRYSKSRKEFDDGFRRTPPYWGKYVFHDNNRDGLQISQELTKAIFKIYYDWHPTVMLDLHESVPLLYISTGTGPYNENVDPIAIGEWQIMANHDITTLAAQGMPGAFTWAFYDGWWPGYGIWVANNHNSIGRFYETFGNAGANTYLRDLSDQNYAGDPATSREWYRPDPPTQKVYWSARNNINYMEAGVLASLTYTADNSRTLLQNFYQKSLNNITKAKTENPKAFVIPKIQKDPAMSAYLVNQLREQGIEVHKAESGDKQGDYVVLMEQPYRGLAVSLLTKQNYPKEAKFPPYDDIAWTLGYLYGVDVKQEDSLKYNLTDLKLLTDAVKYNGTINGEGNNYVLNYKAQNTVLPAINWIKEQNKTSKVYVLDSTAVLIGIKDTLSAGAIAFTGITAAQANQITTQFELDLLATKSPIATKKQHEVTMPRIAIYHSWTYTQDEGWARFTFEQRKIPYASIDKDDLRLGQLRKKFDVIVIPRISGTVSNFIHEIPKKFGPMPYTKTPEYPSHGTPDATNDMTGGPGFEGIKELQLFVEQGGVLITCDNTSALVTEAGIGRELSRANSGALFHPGSVVNVKSRSKTSPILYGFPESFPIFRGNGPLLQTEDYDRKMMVLQYGFKPLKDEEEYKGKILGMPDADKKKETPKDTGKKTEKKEEPYVLSGMVRNEQSIVGHGAIFNVPVGTGRVIAFTFDPLHRYLNHHDAPLVWNAIINWNWLK
jgi:hypothetical protein